MSKPENGEKNQVVAFHSIFAANARVGMVEMYIDEKLVLRVDIRKAKELRDNFGGAIEAAISDELIVKFLTEKVGLDDERAVLALRDFRVMRQGSVDTVTPH